MSTDPDRPAAAAAPHPDPRTRDLIQVAARLLRSIAPADGDLEMMLHEVARRLERLADPAATANPDSPWTLTWFAPTGEDD